MPFAHNPVRRNQTIRQRPWLLLWVLPYLLMSVAGSAHNHGFGESDGAVVTSGFHHSYSSQNAQPQSEKTGKAASTFDCLACQWASHATALFVAPVKLGITADTARLTPTSFTCLLGRTLRTGSIRGPPALS